MSDKQLNENKIDENKLISVWNKHALIFLLNFYYISLLHKLI